MFIVHLIKIIINSPKRSLLICHQNYKIRSTQVNFGLFAQMNDDCYREIKLYLNCKLLKIILVISNIIFNTLFNFNCNMLNLFLLPIRVMNQNVYCFFNDFF